MSNGTIDVRILSIIAGIFLGIVYTLVAVSIFVYDKNGEAVAAFGVLTAIFAGLVGGRIDRYIRRHKREKEYLE